MATIASMTMVAIVITTAATSSSKSRRPLHLPGFTRDHGHADLAGRVVAVGVETVAIVDGLAQLPLLES